MPRSSAIMGFALLIILLLSACSSGSTPAATPTTAKPASTGAGSTVSAGEALVNERCTVCHNTDRIKAARKTQAEWQSTTDRMISHGAKLSPTEQDTVVKYLSDTYKP